MLTNSTTVGAPTAAPQTAGSLLERGVPTVAPTDTIRGALAELQAFAAQYTSIDYIYVVEGGKLVGVLSMHELLQAEPSAHVATAMTTPVVSVHTYTDQERVAAVALAQNISAVPVVDREEIFVGAVSADTILRILREEHTEDILKLAGLVVQPGVTLRSLGSANHIVSRLPWLLLGLGGGLLAAYIVESFTVVLQSQLMLAAFIPAIVYLADAVGSQTQMVYIRSVTIGQQQRLLPTLLQESVVAVVIGGILASVTWVAVYSWFASAQVATVLGLAIIGTVFFSALVGVLLPWAFARSGADPAVASGPLATVIRDVLSLSMYLGIASLLL